MFTDVIPAHSVRTRNFLVENTCAKSYGIFQFLRVRVIAVRDTTRNIFFQLDSVCIPAGLLYVRIPSNNPLVADKMIKVTEGRYRV